MAMAPTASAVSFSAARPSSAADVRPRAASASASRPRPGQQPEGGKWWAPLVGWSGKADYIEPATAVVVVEEEKAAAAARPFVGGLTEEKARQLRARMSEMDSFHDAMYHSAIASRLARST